MPSPRLRAQASRLCLRPLLRLFARVDPDRSARRASSPCAQVCNFRQTCALRFRARLFAFLTHGERRAAQSPGAQVCSFLQTKTLLVPPGVAGASLLQVCKVNQTCAPTGGPRPERRVDRMGATPKFAEKNNLGASALRRAAPRSMPAAARAAGAACSPRREKAGRAREAGTLRPETHGAGMNAPTVLIDPLPAAALQGRPAAEGNSVGRGERGTSVQAASVAEERRRPAPAVIRGGGRESAAATSGSASAPALILRRALGLRLSLGGASNATRVPRRSRRRKFEVCCNLQTCANRLARSLRREVITSRACPAACTEEAAGARDAEAADGCASRGLKRKQRIEAGTEDHAGTEDRGRDAGWGTRLTTALHTRTTTHVAEPPWRPAAGRSRRVAEPPWRPAVRRGESAAEAGRLVGRSEGAGRSDRV